MAAMVQALDNHTPTQYGEKGHIEYTWSNNVQEQILQFSFQVTRTSRPDTLDKLSRQLNRILSTLKNHTMCEAQSIITREYLSILYRMVGHTRDIIDGKGEYELTYMMIYTWYDFYPKLAIFALGCLVDLGKNVHQYGSWKDLKYFYRYCQSVGCSNNHPLLQECILLTNDQLRLDSTSENPSLLAKWVPREDSAFGVQFEPLATHYFAEYMTTAKSPESMAKAIKKCKTQYRKLLTTLNLKLHTTQINQCGGTWSKIKFNEVTSITLAKQKSAFLNKKSTGVPRFPDSSDRNECAIHFKEHIELGKSGAIKIKGKRVGMTDFTKQALHLISMSQANDMPDNQDEIDLLNLQWRDNSSQNGQLGNFIAMVDVSGSMHGDPLYAANALGIRIAEKSKLGKRVMTFSNKPSWVNLENDDDFVSMTAKICTDSGLDTNFYAAMDLILNAIIQSKLSPDEVQDLVLVILSDMQVAQSDKNADMSMHDNIKKRYTDAGMRLYGQPFNPPHILMWNLRSTSGFPCLSYQTNVSMMSGFSPTLLNVFCEKGLDALQSCTPWSILCECLDNHRYTILSDEITLLI
jgi:hypothetical protein